jgi:hypothetical protein
MEIDGDQDADAALRRPPGHSLTSAVVSGDSTDDGENIFEETSDDEGPLYAQDPFNEANSDELYDKDLDEENEAYVYKYLRSGRKEKVKVVEKQDHGEDTTRHITAYKPRNSDAVLSCPLCFNIVCMDSQRHERYHNQFRAMFVMGITVDWHTRLVYDAHNQLLRQKSDNSPIQIPPNYSINEIPQYEDGEYFPVLCANCGTQVAALDMKDEVYHFHGCLESS